MWRCLLPFLLAFPSFLLSAPATGEVVVGAIAIEGANKTQHRVILNEMTVHQGDTLDSHVLEAALTRSRDNIYNLGLFNEVSIQSFPVGDTIHLTVKVVERWYVVGAPLLEVEERNSYDLVNAVLALDFHRLVYGGSVEWRNITGRNETLTVGGHLGFSQRLSVDLLWPALQFSRLNTRLGLRYNNQHETIIGTEGGKAQWRRVETEPLQTSWEAYAGVRKRFDLYKTLYVELHYHSFQFSDSLYAFSLEGQPANTLTNARGVDRYPGLLVQFFEDRRDYRGYPMSGWKYQVMGRITGGPAKVASTSFGKVGLSWAHHLPLGGRWNFAYGSHHIWTIGQRVPFFAKSTLGIDRSEFLGMSTNLRGYQPYAMASTYQGVGKSEWKYALFPRQILHIDQIPYPKFRDVQLGLYLTAFFDAAYLSDDSFSNADQSFQRQWLYSYGFGMNLIGFYDMLLRIEYAWNHLQQGGLYFHADLQIK